MCFTSGSMLYILPLGDHASVLHCMRDRDIHMVCFRLYILYVYVFSTVLCRSVHTVLCTVTMVIPR